jgi:hypothetical protein
MRQGIAYCRYGDYGANDNQLTNIDATFVRLMTSHGFAVPTTINLPTSMRRPAAQAVVMLAEKPSKARTLETPTCILAGRSATDAYSIDFTGIFSIANLLGNRRALKVRAIPTLTGIIDYRFSRWKRFQCRIRGTSANRRTAYSGTTEILTAIFSKLKKTVRTAAR